MDRFLVLLIALVVLIVPTLVNYFTDSNSVFESLKDYQVEFGEKVVPIDDLRRGN